LCLFRVAQEALRNVVRHAGASTVDVSVLKRDGGLQIAVSDNGSGFDPGSHAERPSLGLASIRERVTLLKGEVDIDSARGHGTTVLAWVPIPAAPK
jgi:signal transduction histidine kinase